MNKELVKAFVKECVDIQDWKIKYKSNYVEMNDFFKYSGKVEEEQELISKWKYNENAMCNQIHEYYEKIQTKRGKTKKIRKYLGEERF